MNAAYRRFLRWLLFINWQKRLTYAERVRLNHWGATGNAAHGPYAYLID